MPMPDFITPTTFGIYNYGATVEPDDFGQMPSTDPSNLTLKGTVEGRITPGDSLEPDVLGTNKEQGPDTTSMWIGFFDIPSGFEIENGDWVIDQNDATRKFQVQFIDRYPGGVANHHYEARLQTTELERS
jgi:hypothetical protein